MKLLQIPEVAHRLGVSNGRAYALARDGIIPSVRLGRQVRVEEGQLDQWVAAGGASLPGGARQDGRED